MGESDTLLTAALDLHRDLVAELRYDVSRHRAQLSKMIEVLGNFLDEMGPILVKIEKESKRWPSPPSS